MSLLPESEEPLAGGGLGGAVRVGDTVRRAAGPWTPAVHALLNHLESVGFDGAPRALGFDDQGREVLEYIDGSAGSPTGSPDDDESLASTALLVRRYHDAVVGFAPQASALWQVMIGAPGDGTIICHNDLSPVNTIYASGKARSLIDWDFAAPGTRSWDVAGALYRYVPLYDDTFFEHQSVRPPDRPGRLRLFCDAYGLDDREGLVELVRRRVQVLYESVRTWGQAGLGNYKQLWADTKGRQWLRTIAFIDRERESWERALA